MNATSKSILTSERASIYLQQLCKHFGHKVETSFTPEQGEIIFPFGKCELTAEGSTLTLTAIAQDNENLQKTEQVIGSHLERFAFKEELKVGWS